MPNNIIRWLQISDFHLIDDRAWELASERYLSYFGQYVNNPEKPRPINFVVITGDLHSVSDFAEPGTANACYDETIQFINRLLGRISVTEKKNVFVVPGNHDTDGIDIDGYGTQSFARWAAFLEKFYTNGKEDSPYPDFFKLSSDDEKMEWVKKPHVSVYQERIGEAVSDCLAIVHLNTEIYYKKDKKDGADRICRTDTNFTAINDVLQTQYPTIPSVVLAHHPFENLEEIIDHDQESIKAFVTQFLDNNGVSAYLCGDVHQIEMPRFCCGDHVPCIRCPKFTSQIGDNWSDFGFVIYEWNKITDTVTAYPYSWRVRKSSKDSMEYSEAPSGIQPYHIFRNSNEEDEYTFPMRRLRPHNFCIGKESYIERPDDPNNNPFRFNEDNKYTMARITGKLREYLENKKSKVIVIGDTMLDFILKSSETEIGQSQTHDVTQDFSLINKLSLQKLPGGAGNVAAAFAPLSDVHLFGIIGNDGFGNDLMSVLKSDYNGSKSNNGKICGHLYPVNDYLTITKIYIEEATINATGKRDRIRVAHELKENEGFDTIKEKGCRKLLNDTDSESFINSFREELKTADCIVFKDHEKGFFYSDLRRPNEPQSSELLTKIIEAVNSEMKNRERSGEKKLVVIIDPKYTWYKFNQLERIDAILPNIKEMTAGLYPIINPCDDADKKKRQEIWKSRDLAEELFETDIKLMTQSCEDCSVNGVDKRWWNEKNKVGCIAITEGGNGATIYTPNSAFYDTADANIPGVNKFYSIPGIRITGREYNSEIGCGDVFDAYFTLCLTYKEKLMDSLYDIMRDDDASFYKYALKLANYAAACKIRKGPSRTVTLDELYERMTGDQR